MSSKQDFEEASKLAKSLVARTQDGKIDWAVFDQDAFMYTAPAGIAFHVSHSKSGFGFTMLDPSGHKLIEIVTSPDKEYWELVEGEASASQILPDLYDVARRSALKVNEQVNEINQFLEAL
jgi:hypothetical protein